MHELHDLVTAYRTCEFATLAKDGTPIVWPTVPWQLADGTFLVTTSLGFPQKALNVRRNPRVALLLSDPTASGLDHPDQVLVRGTAVCADEIRTDPAGLEEYWTTLFRRQPSSQAYLTPGANRLMDWYYMRLHIVVTPESITRKPAFQPVARPKTSATPLGAEHIRAFASAVLGACDAEGVPTLVRTVPVPEGDGYTVPVPDDVTVVPGPASLLVHQHDDQLDNVRNVLVRGMLAQSGDKWHLTPSKVVEPSPSTSPAGLVRLIRSTRGATRTYLERRSLARPQVPWPAYRALAGAAKAGAKG